MQLRVIIAKVQAAAGRKKGTHSRHWWLLAAAVSSSAIPRLYPLLSPPN